MLPVQSLYLILNSIRSIWSNFTLSTAALSSKRGVVMLYLSTSFAFPMVISNGFLPRSSLVEIRHCSTPQHRGVGEVTKPICYYFLEIVWYTVER